MSKKIRVTQVRSVIGSTKTQRATMESLGLRKIRQSVELENTPGVAGAIRKVLHLVKVEQL